MEKIDIRKAKNNFGDIAYEQLLKMLLSHELSPGDRIQIDQIADALGISPTPIKHALARLAGQGLVDFRAGLGPFVASPSLREIQHMYDACLMCEAYAIEQGIDNVTNSFLAEIHYLIDAYQAAVRAMEGTREQNNAQIRLDRDFHERIASLDPNPIVLTWYKNINVLLRAFNQAPYLSFKREEAIHEHKAIVDGLAQHEASAAIAALRHHSAMAIAFISEKVKTAGIVAAGGSHEGLNSPGVAGSNGRR